MSTLDWAGSFSSGPTQRGFHHLSFWRLLGLSPSAVTVDNGLNLTMWVIGGINQTSIKQVICTVCTVQYRSVGADFGKVAGCFQLK